VLVVLAFLPGLALRPHHCVIIALTLFPGVASPTRFPATYQAFPSRPSINGGAALERDLILRNENGICDRTESSHRSAS
jgi:hypothetical protein